MTEVSQRLKAHVDQFLQESNLEVALEPVSHFSALDSPISVTELSEGAQRVAAQREFVGSVLSEAEQALSLANALTKAVVEDYEERYDQEMVKNANRLITKGYAVDERRAEAKVSLIEHRIEVRGCERQRDRMESYVKLLRAAYQEWRNTEFALDRITRIETLRHNIGEA